MIQELVVDVPPSVPAPAPAPVPTPEDVLVPRKSLTVPLYAPGRLTAPAREIYALLGIETDILVVQNKEYTVPRNHIALARRAIQDPALPPQMVEISAEVVFVPRLQPRISPTAASVYEALGVDFLDLVSPADEQTIYTVLTAYAQCAGAAKAEGASAHQDGAPQAIPVAGLTLKDFYVGKPPFVTRLLTILFRVRFLRVQNAFGVVYWVTVGPAGIDATLARLNLYV